MAGEEGLQQSRLTLGVTTGREHSTDRGREVLQVLTDLFYLLPLSVCFGLFSSVKSSVQAPCEFATVRQGGKALQGHPQGKAKATSAKG